MEYEKYTITATHTLIEIYILRSHVADRM